MYLKLKEGSEAPVFCLKNQDGDEICLDNLKGRYVILYFYPRDGTSGCTREAMDFTDRVEEFRELNAVILGVSPDSIERHRRFIEKYNLKITLLSDPVHKVIEMFGAWGIKKRYGKEFEGVIRSTFIIDPSGKIIKIWRNVKVRGHVENVLNYLRKYIERVE